MKNLFVIGAMCLALAACGPSEEEKMAVKSALGNDCTLVDAGSYGDIQHLVVVRCNNQDVSTASWNIHAGKVTHHYASVSIQE